MTEYAYEGPKRTVGRGGGVHASIASRDLSGDERILLETSDGQALDLPLCDVDALCWLLNEFARDIDFADAERLQLHHPWRKDELRPLLLGGEDGGSGAREPNTSLPSVLYSAHTILRDGTPEESTPYMEWTPKETESHWALYLPPTGEHPPVKVGTARWNDAQAIADLVKALSSPSSLFVMGGLTNPESIAQISSRKSSRDLARQRKIPSMSVAKARGILETAGLAYPADDISPAHALGRMRFLSLTVDGTRVPIAVCITAPFIPLAIVESHRHESMTLREKAKARSDWVSRARDAFLASGWRTVDLPTPDVKWIYQNELPLWVTRINSHDWARVQAAAEAVAPNVKMERGAKFS